MLKRQEALNLLHEWVKSDSLRRHCLSVAAAMEGYAKKYDLSAEEADKWFICGLLHDFDWERNPTLEEHPKKGCEELRKLGYDNEIIEAIMGHGNHTGVKRDSIMSKTLFAVDELSGLIVALARVRPGNFDGMSAKSVKKAMKKKDFAAAINRDDIKQGIEELGIKEEDMDGHFEIVINALSGIKEELGF
jgi:putative nucleotidyltransferase with HDIG domain